MEAYVLKRAQIIAELQSNIQSSVHVSFDLWISYNSLIFMSVVIHYINNNYKNRIRLIGMKRLYGGHSGENQAKLLLEIFNDYKLTDLLGYFVLDNVILNDVCIDSILRTLLLNFPASKRSQRRLRYYGHILNLAVNVYLWSKDPSSFDQELVINNTLGLK